MLCLEMPSLFPSDEPEQTQCEEVDDFYKTQYTTAEEEASCAAHRNCNTHNQ